MAKKKEVIATKQQSEYLKCALTEKEVALAANDLAKLLDDMQAIEAELVSIKANFKAKLEKCDADIRVKQRLVRDKYEYRYEDCDIEYNYSTLTVKITRKDINAVVEERKMTNLEKQMTMDFDGEEKKQLASK